MAADRLDDGGYGASSRARLSKAGPGASDARRRLFRIIFEADTPAGKRFDVALIWAILFSVAAAMLESVERIRADHGATLRAIEFAITGAFTIEYVLRLYCVDRPLRYATSFLGIVDLLAIVPTYLSLLLPGTQSLAVIRAIRLLRIMRIFKLTAVVEEGSELLRAIRAARHKIGVFLAAVLIINVVLGSTMYLIEGEQGGFTSIPRSIYWAIVTMTTVGYGDIAPVTWLGQVVAAGVMILGYSIIAVPTGIVTAELTQIGKRPVTTRSCPSCTSEGHLPSARFCRDCGAELPPPSEVEE